MAELSIRIGYGVGCVTEFTLSGLCTVSNTAFAVFIMYIGDELVTVCTVVDIIGDLVEFINKLVKSVLIVLGVCFGISLDSVDSVLDFLGSLSSLVGNNATLFNSLIVSVNCSVSIVKVGLYSGTVFDAFFNSCLVAGKCLCGGVNSSLFFSNKIVGDCILCNEVLSGSLGGFVYGIISKNCVQSGHSLVISGIVGSVKILIRLMRSVLQAGEGLNTLCPCAVNKFRSCGDFTLVPYVTVCTSESVGSDCLYVSFSSVNRCLIVSLVSGVATLESGNSRFEFDYLSGGFGGNNISVGYSLFVSFNSSIESSEDGLYSGAVIDVFFNRCLVTGKSSCGGINSGLFFGNKIVGDCILCDEVLNGSLGSFVYGIIGKNCVQSSHSLIISGIVGSVEILITLVLGILLAGEGLRALCPCAVNKFGSCGDFTVVPYVTVCTSESVRCDFVYSGCISVNSCLIVSLVRRVAGLKSGNSGLEFINLCSSFGGNNISVGYSLFVSFNSSIESSEDGLYSGAVIDVFFNRCLVTGKSSCGGINSGLFFGNKIVGDCILCDEVLNGSLGSFVYGIIGKNCVQSSHSLIISGIVGSVEILITLVLGILLAGEGLRALCPCAVNKFGSCGDFTVVPYVTVCTSESVRCDCLYVSFSIVNSCLIVSLISGVAGLKSSNSRFEFGYLSGGFGGNNVTVGYSLFVSFNSSIECGEYGFNSLTGSDVIVGIFNNLGKFIGLGVDIVLIVNRKILSDLIVKDVLNLFLNGVCYVVFVKDLFKFVDYLIISIVIGSCDSFCSGIAAYGAGEGLYTVIPCTVSVLGRVGGYNAGIPSVAEGGNCGRDDDNLITVCALVAFGKTGICAVRSLCVNLCKGLMSTAFKTDDGTVCVPYCGIISRPCLGTAVRSQESVLGDSGNTFKQRTRYVLFIGKIVSVCRVGGTGGKADTIVVVAQTVQRNIFDVNTSESRVTLKAGHCANIVTGC